MVRLAQILLRAGGDGGGGDDGEGGSDNTTKKKTKEGPRSVLAAQITLPTTTTTSESKSKSKSESESTADQGGGGDVNTNRTNTTNTTTVSYVDLSSIAPHARAFFEGGEEMLTRANKLISSAMRNIRNDDEDQDEQEDQDDKTPTTAPPKMISETECTLLAPMDGSLVGKFVCIGMNYRDHCLEQDVPIPKTPLVFNKFGSCIIGTGDDIVKDELVEQLDYEVELGVVIGGGNGNGNGGDGGSPPSSSSSSCAVPRNLSKEEAMRYVGGYTVVHDVSARDWQLDSTKNGGQWVLGKSMDGYAPIGPVICTRDEFAAPKRDGSDLRIVCRVNDEILQESNTDQLIFRVADLVSYLSRFMTLYPGDIIATGTPPGVGCFRKPTPRWLQIGDIVECEIEHIGTIRNPIVGPPSSSSSSSSSVRINRNYNPATTTRTKRRPAGRFDGQVCIVTGAARGLGYAIARRLGTSNENAAFVAIVDLRPDDVDAAVRTLRGEAHHHHHHHDDDDGMTTATSYRGYACDVTKTDAVEKTWKQIAADAAILHGGGRGDGDGDHRPRLDVLVQAAGIVGRTNVKCHDVDPDDMDAVYQVNVKGIFNGCKSVLPYMTSTKYGRIVNIASVAGKEGNAGMLAYSTSKAAVIGLTKTIGKEYAHYTNAEDDDDDDVPADITCNALAPAVVKTQMVAEMPAAQVRYMTDKIPMKRCGTLEEIASMVAFIASREASFTTGYCFDATGGRAVY